jgi:hypothetical protein
MNDRLGAIGKLSVIGLVVIINVITVSALAAYAVIRGAEKEITTTLVTVLAQGAALAFAAAGRFFSQDNRDRPDHQQ